MGQDFKERAALAAELRAKAFSLKPQRIGLDPHMFTEGVYGALMDQGVPEGAFTLFVAADGTTSLYFSTGGGVIGAGGHEPVRQAALRFLSEAQECIQKGEKATTHPLPADGRVIFHFLHLNGVYSHEASAADLYEGEDNLSGIFFAAHNTIAEMRRVEGVQDFLDHGAHGFLDLG